jgi:zinc transport system ATP-binding protein
MKRFSKDAAIVPPVEIISVQHLWAGYDHEPILEDINLSVQANDFIGLLGPNGSGKTTLFRVLLGLLPPLQGTVQIMGLPPEKGRRYIGYVPQTVSFDREFPISVWEVVQLGRLSRRRLLQQFTAHDRQVVQAVLEKLEIAHLRDRAIGQLSGGQRQRVYIARALVTEPKVLLLDEPMASVDQAASSNLYDLLHELNKSVTIVMISHDIGAISTVVKTVGCLNRRLYYHGETQITPEMLNFAYQCPVDLIAHGLPHRVFAPHGDSNHTDSNHTDSNHTDPKNNDD